MEFGAKLLSIIMKLICNNISENNFVIELLAALIDAETGKSIDTIKKFIYNEKSKLTNIISKEKLKSANICDMHIDYVIEEIQVIFSNCVITEKVLRQCGYNPIMLYEYLREEYRKLKKNDIEYESDIERGLYIVAQEFTKLIQESDTFERNLLIQISNSVDENQKELQILSNYMVDNFEKMDSYNQCILEMLKMILEQKRSNELSFKNNRKQDYIDNWNGRMFLHMENEENPVTLANAFIIPDFRLYRPIKGMQFSTDDNLEEIIAKFVHYDKTSILFVVGAPGIGKSSITAWIANNYKSNENVCVLRFRDWEYEEISNGILKAIYNMFACKKSDLEGKILILDGFDEMKTLNIRDKLLMDFMVDIKDLLNFKCIITSRSAYINLDDYENIIELKNFDIEKADFFCKTITGKGLNNKKKIEKNLDVLGIPVILYMAIMSNIDVCQNLNKSELYNRIFAEKGGIFDKFFDGEKGYSSGTQILRAPKNIRKYLEFMNIIAFTMYEKNTLVLSDGEYQVPKLSYHERKTSILEFPIRHLFETSSSNIEFIHKSIYDYFVSEYIFKKIMEKLNTEGTKENNLAGVFGNLFKGNNLSYEILDFLKYKIMKSTLQKEFVIVSNAFYIMLRDGMSFYSNDQCKNIIEVELDIFANMLEILHLGNAVNLQYKTEIGKFLYWNINRKLNLRELDLSNMDLKRINISGANMSVLNLSGSDLREANMSGAKMSFTILKNADLRRADLSHVTMVGAKLEGSKLAGANLSSAIMVSQSLIDINLRGADLRGSDLERANLGGADLRGANLKGAKLRDANVGGALIDESQICHLTQALNIEFVRIYIMRTDTIIDYGEYCRRYLIREE